MRRLQIPLFLLPLFALCFALKDNDGIEYMLLPGVSATYEEAYLACRAVNGTLPVARNGDDDATLKRLKWIANHTDHINDTTIWVGRDGVEKSPEKCYVFDTLDHQIHKQDCNLTAAVLCRVSCKKDAVRYGDLCFWSTGEAPSPYGFLGSSAACASAGYGMPYAHDEAENDFLREYVVKHVLPGCNKGDPDVHSNCLPFLGFQKGDSLPYSNWADGQPAWNEDAYCAQIDKDGKWQVSECGDLKYVVCQQSFIDV